MVFVGIGMLLSPDALGLLDIELDEEGVILTAELTLGLLLFSDAARIDAATLRSAFSLPTRLLGLGLPLTIGLGTVMALVLLPELSWPAAALLAAVVAPTDAALGQAVVSNKSVPVRVRQTLNVESGLNDGLVVPIVAVFAALAAGGVLESRGAIVGEAGAEIGIGIVVGAVLGALLSKLNPWVHENMWTDEGGARLVAFSSAVIAFTASSAFGGNGFIAAFVCGMTVRALIGRETEDHVELAENIGQIGAEVTFVVFGATMVWPALGEATPSIIIFAIGVLTVGRMLPVALALAGTGLKLWTVGFFGWFGPRGLASLLFGLLIIDESNPTKSLLLTIITITILFSVVLHGITAAPGAKAYSRWFAKSGRPDLNELGMLTENPIRWRLGRNPFGQGRDEEVSN